MTALPRLRAAVVRGAGMGRKFGFPTANLDVRRTRVLPLGVFVVRVGGAVAGKELIGLCNVGTRPTLDGRRRTVEVHLPGFSADLYGKTLRVRFIAKIRDEKRFPNLGALKAQIARDVAAAGAVARRLSPPIPCA